MGDFNLTGDTHPIHFHLVNVQIVNRQAFRARNFNGDLRSSPAPPDRRTQMSSVEGDGEDEPGEVTRVIMQFNLPTVPFAVPSSPRAAGALPLGITPGAWRQGCNEYVWHCHILEHEEHDMMRPLVVLS